MKSLFDLSFDRYIAPTVAKIVYILAMVGIGLSYVIFVIAAFNQNGLLGVFVLLILGPIVRLLYLFFVRIGLESLLASIKTAQNTAVLVRLAGGNLPPEEGVYPPPYGQGPAQPYPGQPYPGQPYPGHPATPPTR